MKFVLTKTDVKRAFDVIKLLKTTYTGKIFVSSYDMVNDMIYECEDNPKTNKIFKSGYFTHIEHMLPAQLCGSILDVMRCYDAFKAKCDVLEIGTNNIIELSNGETTYSVGMILDKDTNLRYYTEGMRKISPFFELMDQVQHDEADPSLHYSEVKCGTTTINRLINYETVTVRCEEEPDVGVILTCKCLPNIKKCDAIDIGFIYRDGKETVDTFIVARFSGSIEYRMLLTTLRC